MRVKIEILLLTSCLLGFVTSEECDTPDPSSEKNAMNFLEEYDKVALLNENAHELADWAYETNITDSNQQKYVEQQAKSAVFDKEWREKALKINLTGLSCDSQRQLKKIMDIGKSALPDKEKLNKLNKAVADMTEIFSTATVCLPKELEDLGGTCFTWDNLTNIMNTNRNPAVLEAVWTGWRHETGRKMKDIYKTYVGLTNEAVQQLGDKDGGDSWRKGYESETFEEDVMKLFNQIRPLYEQLHAYVRRRLRETYDNVTFPATGQIPSHLLGNIYAQNWINILDLVQPFKKTSVNITGEMIQQNYTVKEMFDTADEFFQSLGFDSMVPNFWDRSMLEKPTDREVVCHGSAWDFYAPSNDSDFRIKMCTGIEEEDFRTVHHEMGHVQYYMHYQHQPKVYRAGANHGFHEAVGDLIALSFITPEHLHTINLIDKPQGDNESDINFLMKMALNKVAFIPFGYLTDLWRWSVFRGETTPDRYNYDWWELKCAYQGVSPPVTRSEEDFDPGAKYHVAADIEFLRYFISYVIQFQFHEAACNASGHTGPLHKCDIYQSTEAGKLIGDMLSMGSSKPWPEAMKNITGKEQMDAGPLLRYFGPLLEFLRKKNGNDYGWDPHCPRGSIARPKVSVNEDSNSGNTNNGGKTEVKTCDDNQGERIQFSVLTLLIISLASLLFS